MNRVRYSFNVGAVKKTETATQTKRFRSARTDIWRVLKDCLQNYSVTEIRYVTCYDSRDLRIENKNTKRKRRV